MSAKVKLPDPLDKLLRSQLERAIYEAALHRDDEFIAKRRIIDKADQIEVAPTLVGIAALSALTKNTSFNGLPM